MTLNFIKNTVLFFVLVLISCGSGNKQDSKSKKQNTASIKAAANNRSIIVGANQTDIYLPKLKGKNVGVVANQTSVIFKDVSTTQISRNDHYTHLVDSLIALDINISKVFAPEHGFRGQADAGEHIVDGADTKTGLPIFSLYGKNKKPTAAQLQNIDIMVFDIQDVGARFYTYISTLHYIMEACAENKIPLLILDRPNPNGHYIDGPILEPKHKSFVGMHPVPVVHGMTIGEYAQMINGEHWLKNGSQCKLTVVPVKNYTHQTSYSLPIKPSPNLPNDTAINLYPSLCFFEGTNISVGRGTDMQFQVIGSPFLSMHSFAFTPMSNVGAKHPKYEGRSCYGIDLRRTPPLNSLNLHWLLELYNLNQHSVPHDAFFNRFFTKLAGTETLQKQIEAGWSEAEIKASWQDGLNAFKKMRKQYLIYP